MSITSHGPPSAGPWVGPDRAPRPGAELSVRPPLAVITLTGQIDMANAESFRRAAEGAWREDVTTVVVDVHSCSFMDSSGVCVLTSLVRGAAERGTMLRIAGANEIMRTLLAVSGLTDVVRMEP